MHPRLEDHLQRKAKLMEMGGPDKVARQHKAGKLTCRERLDLLFDKGTFEEIGLFVKHLGTGLGMADKEIPADGVVTGFGKVNGRLTYAYALDFTSMGGTVGHMGGEKIVRLMKEAIELGCPIISLNDGGGGRIHEASIGYSHVFYHNVIASGFVPQVSAVMGMCAGGAAYSPALTDHIIMVDKTSKMYITTPRVIKEVNNEEVDEEYYGSARYNSEISGVCHGIARDDYDCIEQIKKYLSYLPQNCLEKPPVYPCEGDKDALVPELNTILPEKIYKAYDMHYVIELIVDKGSQFEIQPDWARNVITSLARLYGKSVGIVASQPKVMGGAIDINASDKMCRFITMCDSYNIPIVWLADTPGYLPGSNQESGGIIRHGAKVLYANCTATVPKVRITLRKNYGGAKAATCEKAMGTDYVLSWPTADEATMGAAGAIQVIYAQELKEAKKQGPEAYEAKVADLSKKYLDHLDGPYLRAGRLWTDMVIMPDETRRVLIRILEALENKKPKPELKKHGNFPV